MTDTLTALQQAILNRLGYCPELSGLTLLALDPRTPLTASDARVTRSSGTSIVVATPEIAPEQTMPLKTLQRIRLTLEIHDHSSGHGSTFFITRIAHQLSLRLHGWMPPVSGICRALLLDSDSSLTSKDQANERNRRTLRLVFHSLINPQQLQRV